MRPTKVLFWLPPLLIGACSVGPASDNTPAICAEFRQKVVEFAKPDSTEPEAVAYADAVRAGFDGTPALPPEEFAKVRRTYLQAQIQRARDLATRATNPTTRDGLNAFADEMEQVADGADLDASRPPLIYQTCLR
ncbi:hypothetical protein [Spirilliplanes yamanashiensis]|uniref:Lipoprotein n=1 Tax=Spirilliplanes yamanashiensis TaxID=42233 RepID=A0A8J3YEB0_9ACTN|nr:hypothetical protein [Spirilliplanes yamanashiensis]MDP9815233.1 acyl-CoA reductase-like NAD-dependent aldehyde dehydrogenase [Spirilliplanes yamanashiensis]GIJ06499.1 hypothetical protein Sya03_58510 [Spirilliplanes yamanashiensis]